MATYTIDNIKLPNGDICNIKDTTYAVATGDGNGQIKVTPSSGSAYNVNVKGLGTAAYKNITNSYADNGTDPITGTGVNNALYEANLKWGGKNFAASYAPIDAALADELGGNRFQFLRSEAITVEYSRDGGSTWTDYEASDSNKQKIFAQGGSFYIGKASSTDKATEHPGQYQLRITIDTGVGRVYTNLNKFIVYVSTNGSANCVCKIQKALESTPTTFIDHTDFITISGWSGYNVINCSGITTYGNSPNAQYGRLRFIFKDGEGGNTSYVGLSVVQIKAFGGVGWITPSTMAKTGHLYTYDENLNATFPATITATNFIGGLQTTDISIANGDKLVVTDSSNSNKVSRTSLSFDGSTTTKCLTQKGTWETFSNNSGTVTSVDASGNNGISISGSPITSSGTITIGLNLSTAINGLSEGTSSATANDYIVAQYAGGGTSNTTYYRRKVGKILDALTSTQVVTALGYTPPTENTTYTANTTSIGSASGWSAGTTPSLSYTSRSIPNVTAANTPTTAVISGGTLTFTAGTALTLGTAISADDITSWSAGTAPSLTVTSTTVATGITAT